LPKISLTIFKVSTVAFILASFNISAFFKSSSKEFFKISDFCNSVNCVCAFIALAASWLIVTFVFAKNASLSFNCSCSFICLPAFSMSKAVCFLTASILASESLILFSSASFLSFAALSLNSFDFFAASSFAFSILLVFSI
jgi:hypothetical protein